MKLEYKLYLAIIISAIFVVVAVTTISRSVLTNAVLQEKFLEIQGHVLHAASIGELTDESINYPAEKHSQDLFEAFVNDVRIASVARITLWSVDKVAIYSDLKSLIGADEIRNPELDQAMTDGKAFFVRKTVDNNLPQQTDIGEFLDIFVPVVRAGHVAVVVEIHAATEAILASVSTALTDIAISIVLGVLIALLAVYFVIRQFVVKPMIALEAANQKVMDGDFNTTIEIKRKDEFGMLGESFNSMTKGLRRLKELQNEFVFVATHELRTPVTAIAGFLELLLQGKEKMSMPKESVEYAQLAQQAADRLKNLVNDLLEIARSEAGKIEINIVPCDLEKSINDVIAEVSPLAKKKQITFSFGAGMGSHKVLVDQGRLKEILANLLSNAIKYSGEKTVVDVSLEDQAEMVTVNVEDHGFGISIEEQKKVFEKFFRSHEENVRQVGGTGLGLFIVKELVERQGGKIWFKSELGKGSTFSFSLKKV